MDDLSNEPWQAYSDNNARKGAMDGRKEARSMWVGYPLWPSSFADHFWAGLVQIQAPLPLVSRLMGQGRGTGCRARRETQGLAFSGQPTTVR
ncbi:hypothetical protein PspLS_05788 [Pyricularia sp. CBS 133598]|nr:hypothetical protein PspLS_05788 [Pyricularia sp. CBS 133598]